MIYVTITLYCEYIFANNVTIMFLVFKFKKTDDLFALKNIHLWGLLCATDGTWVTCLKHVYKSSCSGYLNTQLDAKFRACVITELSKGAENFSCKLGQKRKKYVSVLGKLCGGSYVTAVR